MVNLKGSPLPSFFWNCSSFYAFDFKFEALEIPNFAQRTFQARDNAFHLILEYYDVPFFSSEFDDSENELSNSESKNDDY